MTCLTHRIDKDEPDTQLDVPLTDYLLTSTSECGSVTYEFRTELQTDVNDPTSIDTSVDLFSGTSPLAVFDPVNMILTFSGIRDYTSGILIVKVKVRQDIPATATDAAYESAVAYDEVATNIRVFSCLTEAISRSNNKELKDACECQDHGIIDFANMTIAPETTQINQTYDIGLPLCERMSKQGCTFDWET